MHTIPDLRRPHRIAVLASIDVVNRVTAADLDRPTPCSGWTLGDLLSHMTVQHRGFAASARGGGHDITLWHPEPADDPVVEYGAAAADVLDAFAPDEVLEATCALPEFGADVTVPGRAAVSFHFIDYVVHGWDVARTIGVAFELPIDVLEAALPVAMNVPAGDYRSSPGAAFGPALEPPAAPDLLATILAHLGRNPEWTPPGR